ncbi:MAG: tRNA (adenosine(37)-N6)-threonylcarbamoyltransferase complex dimerization subunit type 1 TsaB [Flavobacteriales bacterium]|nr:tRNA (adenosine(37)-N6)-threonylcarbamoyltransferase complex dimerization subunit type 1 TsaB [Flavobacteriaceae bacterium]RZP08762.1 MAG: tRNA (adenosine(37)-N6)-threonylcarbamoyltransferase complex dimerization subunit type 1 TsaB [Flavobacteriales bacterium]|tara:strand:- start:49 stop:726 length:678 start_codon:yes stop_codon:yes gene_type:complete
MSFILNIESSSTNCSVSLTKNGDLISIKENNDEKYSHSTKLHSFINEVISDSKITINELSAIAVSKGPGSYTGLRIGVAAAKGLCFSLDIPLISVSTLLILSKQIKISSGLILPVLDARRNEVYSAIYDANYKLVKKESPKLIDSKSFENFSNDNQLYFIGSGQQKCRELIKSNNNLIFHNNESLPSSKEMADISYQKFISSDFEDLAYFEPAYLKNFILDSVNR